MSARVHGGPGAAGAARWDFSTNANAAGPCPAALAAVRDADTTRYPDPGYEVLRGRLAALHGVVPERVVIAASASEFIFRMTAAVDGPVWVPPHAYGDYAQAARAHGREQVAQARQAALAWGCEPSSPLGQSADGADACDITVLDLAYAPLRLSGRSRFSPDQLDCLWRLWTPNKALGLSGVRAAYAIAPRHDRGMTERLASLAPSWPLGAHGVALLTAWCEPPVRQWLDASLDTLRDWKARQVDVCESLGWRVTPGEANYFCATPDQPALVPALRALGVQLRDTASFGLPGQVRLSVQAPQAQDALAAAWRQLRGGDRS